MRKQLITKHRFGDSETRQFIIFCCITDDDEVQLVDFCIPKWI